jgi:hypothetical protein
LICVFAGYFGPNFYRLPFARRREIPRVLALMAMMFDQFRTLPHGLRNVMTNAFCGFLTTFRLPTRFQKKAPEAQRFLSTFGSIRLASVRSNLSIIK